MNRTIRDVLLFGAGFAAGAYVMHTVFRTKYQEYADAQIDDVRDHYRKKEADLDAMIEEKAQQKSMEQLTGKYRTESDPEDIAPHDPIEIIQPDEFGDIPVLSLPPTSAVIPAVTALALTSAVSTW